MFAEEMRCLFSRMALSSAVAAKNVCAFECAERGSDVEEVEFEVGSVIAATVEELEVPPPGLW